MMAMMSHMANVVLWGFIATIVMTTIMLGAQGLGLSRLSLPYLVGTAATKRHRLAYTFGYVIYGLGAWAFAFLYDALFVVFGRPSWWLGAVIGTLHGTFLLAALMHAPLIHPRMASDYDRPRSGRVIEPPGFFGLHYGRRTPVIAILAHAIFGAVLGAGLALSA